MLRVSIKNQRRSDQPSTEIYSEDSNDAPQSSSTLDTVQHGSQRVSRQNQRRSGHSPMGIYSEDSSDASHYSSRLDMRAETNDHTNKISLPYMRGDFSHRKCVFSCPQTV